MCLQLLCDHDAGMTVLLNDAATEDNPLRDGGV